MDNFVVVRLCSDKFSFIPKVKGFKDVDLRPARIESENEKNAVLSSARAFGIEYLDSMCMRIVTTVPAIEARSAVAMAKERFDNALNCMFVNWNGLEEAAILPVGYTRNLLTGEIHPILPERKSYNPIFQIVAEKYPPIMLDQWLSFNSEVSDVAKALLRSSHWRRLAIFEEKMELKFLFHWIAIESISKVTENDDIVPKLMLAMGFPTSKFTGILSKPFLSRLSDHPDYKVWKNWLKTLFYEMKSFRNDVVHSGFRKLEMNPSRLQTFEKIIQLTTPRIQGFIEVGYTNNLTSIPEIWDYAPFIFEQLPHVIESVHGTIIYQLNSEFRSSI